MEKTLKNKKYYSQEGIFEKVAKNYPFGKIIIFLFDFLFLLIRTFIFSKNKSGNLIVISLHRLGDTVFTIPAVKEIFKNYESNNKIILCYPESKNIYKLVFKDEIQTIDKSDLKFGSRIANNHARKILKKLNPQTIVDLTGTVASASLIFDSRASKIAGMNERIFKGIYTDYTIRRKIPHLIDTYLDIAQLVSDFNRTKDIYQFKAEINSRGKILIHPFSVHQAKEWNLEKFISLAENLMDDYSVEIISPENKLPEDAKEIIIQKGIPFYITKTMEDLISKINESSVFISNDTGPLYIANLLGKATFTIYGPTNPEFSLPFGKYHDYIQKKIECSPEAGYQYCYTLGGVYCPLYECMNQLSVQEVYDSIKAFFKKIGIKKIEPVS